MAQHQLQHIIDNAWDNRATINAENATPEVMDAVNHVIAELNGGRLRVATREGVGQWTVHQWLKKAVLLSFRLNDNKIIKGGDLGYYDKVKTKFSNLSDEEFKAAGVQFVSDVDLPAFQKVTASVYKAFPKWTPGLHDTIMSALRK